MTRHLLGVALMCVMCTGGTAAAQTYDLYLDNGIVRVGVETDEYGGAITYLSVSGETRNLINNHDRGRQVQQSYYAGGDVDRSADGQNPNWSPWPWNPIQVGDSYGNSSTVLTQTATNNELYVKTQPLLWDMNNEAGECYFETWIRLDGLSVHVRNKLTTFRTDYMWSALARHQELPAVYTIGDLYELYTYEGASPFTKSALSQIVNSGPPWAYWGQSQPTENWAAFVDASSWGVGVYNSEAEEFIGGFHGTPGGGEFNSATGYISPLRTETLRKSTVYEYEYDLIVGELDVIRAFVYNEEGYSDYDGDGLTFDNETRDFDPDTPGIQNPFDVLQDDTTGDDEDPNPDGIPDGQNDWDGDGMLNANEFQMGFDPTDPSSHYDPATMPLLSWTGTAVLAATILTAALLLALRPWAKNRG